VEDAVVRWILGIIVVPGLVWATTVVWLLRDIKRGTDQVLHLHEHPETTGFGTEALGASFLRMEHSMHELVHYVKWGVQQQNEKVPPPPEPSI
jgi:hypothetical protein